MKLKKENIIQLLFCYNLILINDFVSGSISIFDEKNSTLINIDDLTAAFGPRLPDNGFIGYINPSEPIHGCTTIKSPPNISFVEPKQWIALIQRTPTKYGNCSFDLKIYNAQQAGYSAVIIFNSESDALIRMSSSGAFRILIPSVFVGRSSGYLIESSYTYKNRSLIIITNDDADLSYLLIPFICVISVCFIVAISIFIVKFAIHFYKLRKNRFPKSALKKIPTKKYQKTDKYDTCPICLNEYEEGVKIRILPCEHAYHIECIDKWLLRNNRFCPVCKRRVLPGGSDTESSDESTENSSASNNNNNTTTTTNNNNNDNRQNNVENQPNDEEDTNESSRLLVTVRNNNDDNISSVTLNTATLNSSNMNQANDLSSLNNQMTTSATSSQVLSQQQQQLRSSSSRYGSISSVNNILSNCMPQTSKTHDNDDDDDDEFLLKDKKSNNLLIKDSKATPDNNEYFTPNSNIAIDNNSFKQDFNKDQQQQQQLTTASTNKKTKKIKSVRKSNSTNQILKHEPTVTIENESSSSSASFTQSQDMSDTAVLILKPNNTRKSNLARSLSPKAKKPSSNNNNNRSSNQNNSNVYNNAQQNDDDDDLKNNI